VTYTQVAGTSNFIIIIIRPIIINETINVALQGWHKLAHESGTIFCYQKLAPNGATFYSVQLSTTKKTWHSLKKLA